MKNDPTQAHLIQKARSHKSHKSTVIDVLVNPLVVEQNTQKISERPVRKRRTNYAKKIMNDPFIMSV